FDRTLLYSPDSRFVLAGIVNRMDRAYLAEANCGEIRLIYRLTRTDGQGTDVPPTADAATSPRLPMTLNVVLKAKADHATTRGGVAISCAEIARRWLATADSPLTGAELAEQLLSSNGPLDLIEPANIDLMETNLQIARAQNPAPRVSRPDYLLKFFHYTAQNGAWEPVPLENQID